MQVKLGEDIEEKKAEMQKQKEEEEKYRIQREATEAEFNKCFKDGATSVYNRDGKFYFRGDVSHCGRDHIFNNAKEIKKRMLQDGKKYGHMNCNDLPTFENSFNWEKDEKERKEMYKDDLYIFEGEDIKVVALIFEEEQKQRYCLDETDDEEDDYSEQEEEVIM